MRECRSTGDHLNGSYLLPPDLSVERLDRNLLEVVMADLIAKDGLSHQWEGRDQSDGE